MVHDGADVAGGPARLDAVRVEFNEERLVSDAGLLLAATLADRLGLQELVNESVWLPYGIPGASLPGRKVMTLVHGMLAGADSIDDMGLLRAGCTQLILGHRVMAPSTLVTFLRAFTFGHVRQLDRVLDVALVRAWEAGAGPGDGPLVIDVDSLVGEVHGHEKQGASYGYTRQFGYHPILATRADTGEVLHIRNRDGRANTLRGARRFVDELLARVRRAGHRGTIVIRADSGFENHKLMAALDRQGVAFSIGVRQHKHIRTLIDQIPETDWVTVSDDPEGGEAQVAETPLGSFRVDRAPYPADRAKGRAVAELALPLLRDQPDRPDADRRHRSRDHASIELTIRDLKDQALAHFPTGKFQANSAWSVIAALAHNLARWTTLIGLPNRPVQTAAARRNHLLRIPGRLTRTSRQWTLRLPARWPWKTDFLTVLHAIRALPART